MLSTTAALYGQGMGEKVALITDGRFSGGHAWLCIGLLERVQVMRSPSLSRPIGPASALPDQTWPMQKPRVPPLKRPSVMSATFFAHALAVERSGGR